MVDHDSDRGRVLCVDLTVKTASDYLWSERERSRYPGGKAMAAGLLLAHLTGRERALCEDNPIVITTGALTGTGAPGSARFDIASLSPKDDRPAFSNCGGSLGIHLKRSGYDALILTGRCSAPCWLEIRGSEVLFHDAQPLRGTGTGACTETLRKHPQLEDAGIACIGPAGEHLVKIASVLCDGHTAGRAGIGAVFGWKNLKAVAISGANAIALHDPAAFDARNRAWHAALGEHSGRSTSDSGSFCDGCPIHCARRRKGALQSTLDELGLDAIAAQDAAARAKELGLPTDGIFQRLAHSAELADRLAVPGAAKKGGNRRSGSSHAIAKAFGLSPEDPETARFCRTLTEAVSVAGQCMFTLNALSGDDPLRDLLELWFCATGQRMTLDGLLAVGQRSLDAERALSDRFARSRSLCSCHGSDPMLK